MSHITDNKYNWIDRSRLYAIGIFLSATLLQLTSLRLMSAYGFNDEITKYLLFTNIFGVLLSLDFGIQPTISRKIREYYVIGSNVKILKCIHAYTNFAIVVSGFFFITGVSVILYISDWHTSSLILAVLVAVQCIATYISMIYVSALKAMDNYKSVFFTQSAVAIAAILSSLLIVIGAKISYGVPIVLALSQLFILYLLRVVVYRIIGSIPYTEQNEIFFVKIKKTFIEVKDYAINGVAVVLTNQGQRLLMAKLLGAEDSGALTSLINILGKIHQICAMYTEILFYRAVCIRGRDLLIEYVRESVLIIGLSIIPLIFAIIFGDVVYSYFLGPKLGSIASDINPYVCIIIFIMCLSCPASYTMNAIGAVGYNTFYSIANSMLFLLILVCMYDFVTQSATHYVGVLSMVYIANAVVYHTAVIMKIRST